MIEQGLLLTVVGMVMVFVFLGILVYAVHGLAKLVQISEKYFPAAGDKQTVPAAPAAPKDDASKIAAAIAAASKYIKK